MFASERNDLNFERKKFKRKFVQIVALRDQYNYILNGLLIRTVQSDDQWLSEAMTNEMNKAGTEPKSLLICHSLSHGSSI